MKSRDKHVSIYRHFPQSYDRCAASFVWKVLTDFEQYSSWNPFTPKAESTLEIGSPARLVVRLWPTHTKITEIVRAVEPPHLLSWHKEFPHKSVLYAVRNQIVEPNSQLSSVYYNIDILTGLIAPIVGPLFRKYMERGFNEVGNALKVHAECLYNS